MCEATAHHLAGFATGAALAMHAHQPAWVAVGSACLATVTAGGVLSPDVDQFRVWRAMDRWLPDEWLGEGGPLQHRGLSHFWGIPATVGAWLYTSGGPWWAFMLLAGWVSHLVLDFAVGKRAWGRGPGIPLAPWWAHHGLGGDAGGLLERRVLRSWRGRCWGRWSGRRRPHGRRHGEGRSGDSGASGLSRYNAALYNEGMRTMQTAEPLQCLPLSEGAEPVEQIVFYRSLVLDPPYQRGSIWGVARQRNLIRSLLRGIPTGSIYLNTRPDHDLTLAVVDGKQRIEAVGAFLSDHLAVPASWFTAEFVEATEGTDDGPYVRWSGLSVVGRRRFQRARFTTLRTELATVEEEAELFEIVNYGGVPQGERDDG